MRFIYDFFKSPAHDSATATALYAPYSVTGARYRETSKTWLGGCMHCSSDLHYLLCMLYIV